MDKKLFEDEINSLQKEYIIQLPNKYTELTQLLSAGFDATATAKVAALCHKLVGSSGTYGFKSLSKLFRIMQNEIVSGAVFSRSEEDRSQFFKLWQQKLLLLIMAYQKLLPVSFKTMPFSTAVQRIDEALHKKITIFHSQGESIP